MWNKTACLFVLTWRSAELLAPSKYHHHSANANAMLVNAVEAAATLQVFWLSMPRITDATNSPDRKSTRLNSSHQIISYAVFCLKKKKKIKTKTRPIKQKYTSQNE